MRVYLKVFASWRMFIVLLMGFASGLPLALTGSTLQAWMTSEKVDLTVIGIFSLVGVPYTFKYAWAPLMDRYVPPFLGRRRGWMLLSQLGLVIGIGAMAFTQPASEPWIVAGLAVFIAFCSASQDIVMDAYRTEVLHKEEMGAGAAIAIMGYRIAMLTSGALALILSDSLPWKAVYLIMAALMGVGVLCAFFGPEPQVQVKPPKTLAEAVIQPFVEFLKRRGAFEILAFIVLYKAGFAMAVALQTKFMMELGFTKTDIGVVTKGFGLVATIVGTLAGGAAMAKFGIRRSLWVFGIIQGLANLTFIILARLGQNYPAMTASIAIDNFCGGLGTAAFTAFLMSLCDPRFTATQYALLTSFMAFTRVVITSPSGFLVKTLGWEMYFVACTVFAIPGLLLLTRSSRWQDGART